MGNNKRGKMLPKFKRKKVFFHTAAAPFLKKQLKLNIRVCVTSSSCALTTSSSKQQNFKQTNKTNKKVILAIRKRPRAKINAHNHRQTNTHTPTTKIDPTCAAVSQINVRACYFCVSQRIENLLIEPSCSSNTITTGKGAEQNF